MVTGGPGCGPEPYLYISFAEDNRAYVWAAVSRLKAMGMRTFMVPSGAEIPGEDELRRRVADAVAVLAFVSASALTSHRCRREWIEAAGCQKPVFVTYLGGMFMSPVQQHLLGALPIVPLEAQTREQWAPAVASIPLLRSALGGPAGETPAPWPSGIGAEDKSAFVWMLVRADNEENLRCLYPDFIVGRSTKTAHYVFPEKTISREQLRFSYWNETWHAVHLRETSLSFLNGSEMDTGTEYDLAEGDEISFGSQRLVLKRRPANLSLTYMAVNEPTETVQKTSLRPPGASAPVPPAAAPASSAVAASGGRLPFLRAEGSGEEIAIDHFPYLMGRSRSCDLTIPVKTVSSHHAEIRKEAAGYVLRDLGSTNGTRLNGETIAPKTDCPLRNGDCFALHEESYRFYTV